MTFPLRITDLEFLLPVALLYSLAIFATSIAASAVLVRSSSKVRSLLTPQTERNGCLDGLRGLSGAECLHPSLLHRIRVFYARPMAVEFQPAIQSIGPVLGLNVLYADRLLILATIAQISRRPRRRMARAVRIESGPLGPLYATVVSAVVLSVFALTNWSLQVPPAALARELACWYLFVIPGRPDINLLPDTATIIAGVNWSLAYEWGFYFALPLLYFPLRFFKPAQSSPEVPFRCSYWYFLIGALRGHDVQELRLYLLHFGSGILASLIYRDPALRRLISESIFLHGAALVGLLVLGCLSDLAQHIGCWTDACILSGRAGWFRSVWPAGSAVDYLAWRDQLRHLFGAWNVHILDIGIF